MRKDFFFLRYQTREVRRLYVVNVLMKLYRKNNNNQKSLYIVRYRCDVNMW